MDIKNILIAGVGGQGLVMATNIVSKVAFYEGNDIKTSDVIGLSQRGGLVWGCIRFGKEVPSPLIPYGKGDILLAMEQLEALRWTHLMKANAKVILNSEKIYPNRVLIEKEEYPENIEQTLKNKGFEVYLLDAEKEAEELGNFKVSNIVLLGFLAGMLPFNDTSWIKVIGENVPEKTIKINIDAFNIGRIKYENIHKNR